MSRLTAAKARLLPVIEADGMWALAGARSFAVWLSHQHAMSINAARTQVRLAQRLRDDLPVTAAAAAAGDAAVGRVRRPGRRRPRARGGRGP